MFFLAEAAGPSDSAPAQAPKQPHALSAGSGSQSSTAAFDGVFPKARAVGYRHPAPAGCGVVAHRRLAGADDLYTARAANRQPAPEGGGRTGCWLLQTTSSLPGPPPGSRLLLTVGRHVCHLPSRKLDGCTYLGQCPAAGSGQLRAAAPPLAKSFRLPARQQHRPPHPH